MPLNLNLFVREATKEALKSPVEKKYGAVLVYRNRIVSRGHNYHRMCRSGGGGKLKGCILCS